MKIAFDIGGVLSKFPFEFVSLIDTLVGAGHDVYVISDMHPIEKIVEALAANGFGELVPRHRIYSSDYKTHGEASKAVLCRELGIQMLVDDFGGYLVWPWPEPAPIRLLVQPDPRRPYWHPEWVTADNFDFGRRVYSQGTIL